MMKKMFFLLSFLLLAHSAPKVHAFSAAHINLGLNLLTSGAFIWCVCSLTRAIEKILSLKNTLHADDEVRGSQLTRNKIDLTYLQSLEARLRVAYLVVNTPLELLKALGFSEKELLQAAELQALARGADDMQIEDEDFWQEDAAHMGDAHDTTDKAF